MTTKRGDFIKSNMAEMSDNKIEKHLHADDLRPIREIGRKSVFLFNRSELDASQQWGRYYYNKLEEKSPFFRVLSGDWRATDPTMNIVVFSALAPAGFHAGKTLNKDIGEAISWGDTLRKETIIHSHHKACLVHALNSIEEIIKHSILLDTKVSEPSSKAKMPWTAFMHSFYCVYQDADGCHLLKLFAEESLMKGGHETFIRAYELKEIKNEVFARGVQPALGLSDAMTSSKYKVSDLYAIVKQYDKDFTPFPK